MVAGSLERGVRSVSLRARRESVRFVALVSALTRTSHETGRSFGVATQRSARAMRDSSHVANLSSRAALTPPTCRHLW
jgi:hypothetical protein